MMNTSSKALAIVLGSALAIGAMAPTAHASDNDRGHTTGGFTIDSLDLAPGTMWTGEPEFVGNEVEYRYQSNNGTWETETLRCDDGGNEVRVWVYGNGNYYIYCYPH